MTLNKDLLKREYEKFAEGNSGETRIQTQDESFDVITESLRTGEVSPIYDQHVETSHGGLFPLSSVNYELTSVYYMDMDGYKNFSFQLCISASGSYQASSHGVMMVTLTPEVTNQDDGTAAASCMYNVVPSSMFLPYYSPDIVPVSTVNTFPYLCSSFYLQRDMPCKYVRFRLSLSTDDYGSTSASPDQMRVDIFTKKLY
jgi:hypothetical protein